MKGLPKSLLVIALLAVTLSAIAQRQLTVMTYNVQNGVGLDNQRDHVRVARVIRSLAPDIVGIQEVDSMSFRSGQTFVLGEIADSAGLIPVFAPAISHDGGLYGIGLLSSVASDSVRVVPLPGREEERVLLIAYFSDYIIANTHLSLTPEDALTSAGKIRQMFASECKRPIVLMGDLNSLPDSPVIRELQHDFVIVSPYGVPTYPADMPDATIDYIMIDRTATCSINRAEVVGDSLASDHRPVVVTLTFQE